MNVNRSNKRHKPRTLKNIKRINWKAIIIAILVTGFAIAAWGFLQNRTNQAKIERDLNSKIVLKEKKLDELNKLNETNTKEKQDLKKETEDLKKQLEAKRAKQESDRVYAASYSEAVGNAGDARSYIYQHESGNRTNAINSGSGACGLGQAYPCSKLPCSLHDYICQDNWFTNYAMTRYGSWEAAANYWYNHHNW